MQFMATKRRQSLPLAHVGSMANNVWRRTVLHSMQANGARNTRPGIRAVDRFLLDGDLGTERRVWFDQFALLAEMMRAPHIVPGFFRYRFGRRAR